MHINAVWIGDRLTTVERVCLASWAHYGHQVRLWCYDPILNQPDGVEVMEAREFMPCAIHRYSDEKHKGSPVLQANLFRYRWILLMGEPFIDCDTLCNTYEFPDANMISSEGGDRHPNFACVCVESMNPIAQWMWDEAMRIVDAGPVPWGVVGPRLLKRGMDLFPELRLALRPSQEWCPIHWNEWTHITQPDPPAVLDGSHGCHLWAQMMRRHGFDPDGKYPESCLWEQWKRKFLPC